MMGILTSPSFLATVGIILSGYALYVEHKVHHLKEGEEFSAMCDIEAIKASCSAVFQLPRVTCLVTLDWFRKNPC
ncbi:hypothetical protein MHU86_5471 [Fragilaria crotonensis]|nr:hypothetical protein MHU86_5471 [Fragilaria crotonensis]